MDLYPSEEQQALRDTVVRFAAARFPVEVTRSWGTPGGFSRVAWHELADLGTFGLVLEEADGGAGLGTIEQVLVHEALGAGLVPGPLVAASLCAGLAPGVLDGSSVPAVVETAGPGPWLVEHLRDADVLLVVGADGVQLAEAASVVRDEAEHPTDPSTPVSILVRLPAGEPVGGAEEADRLRLLGSLLVSAQLVGLSAATTDRAVRYVSERQQFGRPVGSFQGVKHLLADSFVRTEVARCALWAAAVTTDEPEAGDLARAVAGTRVLAARAALQNAKTCVQLHGGMGFTWEVDAHLYLKRAIVLESLFGSVDEAALLVAATLGSPCD